MNFASCNFAHFSGIPQKFPSDFPKICLFNGGYGIVGSAKNDGWPGVLAFLNGCDLRSALRGQVLLAKMFGTILAVGGGLALGPEGWGDEN